MATESLVSDHDQGPLGTEAIPTVREVAPQTSPSPTAPPAGVVADRPAVGTRQDGNGVPKRFSFRFSIWSARAASWIVWAMPGPARDLLAALGAYAFFRFSQTYRENVLSNIRQVLGPEVEQAAVDATVRRVFRTSAQNFIDLMLSPRMSPDAVRNAVKLSPEARATLDSALALGHGAVIVSAHLGAFDFIGQGLNLNGYPLTVVTARTTSRFVFDGVTYLRGVHGPAMVEPTPAGIRRTIQALRQGRCAAILVDRDFFQNGRSVTFFGRETTLPIGALRIARESGAPIVPVLTHRTDSGHVLTVYDPITIDRTTNIDADLESALHRLVPVLERAIGGAPGQWVMFQRVWPESPVDPVRAFPVGSPFATAPERPPAAGLPARLARPARRHPGR